MWWVARVRDLLGVEYDLRSALGGCTRRVCIISVSGIDTYTGEARRWQLFILTYLPLCLEHILALVVRNPFLTSDILQQCPS